MRQINHECRKTKEKWDCQDGINENVSKNLYMALQQKMSRSLMLTDLEINSFSCALSKVIFWFSTVLNKRVYTTVGGLSVADVGFHIWGRGGV